LGIIQAAYYARRQSLRPPGLAQSINNYLALGSFQQMGWKTVPYTDTAPVRDHATDEIVVGHIAAVRAGLRALHPYLGRGLWPSTINAVAAHPPKAGRYL